MYFEKITRFEIAERQLTHAIELYLANDHLVSAITLAGAADGVLGDLVNKKGKPNALEEKVAKLCGMFEAVFKTKANPKDFFILRNNARNRFKHADDATHEADTVEINLEDEAVKMIDRGIKNYNKLHGRRQPLFREFQKERTRRYRLRASESEVVCHGKA